LRVRQEWNSTVRIVLVTDCRGQLYKMKFLRKKVKEIVKVSQLFLKKIAEAFKFLEK
jgi:hypothetical protein